jgi:UDP-N-acetylglucosamine diphosphorylase/glucosamine-1-phosphate N-acetyltransferase
MHLVLFDDATRHSLLPFTHTRPIADIRCGILTMRERWQRLLEHTVSGSLTEDYLSEAFTYTESVDHLLVAGGVIGTFLLTQAIALLKPGEVLTNNDEIIATRITGKLPAYTDIERATASYTRINFEGEVQKIRRPWDIFSLNDQVLRADYAAITANRTSAPIPEGVIAINPSNIFIEPTARLLPGTIINASDGPVYIDNGAEVMEGCMLRGPVSLGKHAVLKMGARIYSGSTIGPNCVVGGEISNVVFFANSNKGHDGFLGNAVIGEWCNLGADTNCSNLKNNYDEVKVWDEHLQKSVKTGLTFCGLIMGDHSKCGINTMFNTGTITGVSCNIWGTGFPEKFIPSFTWGGIESSVTYDFNRAMETAERMMARRNRKLSEAERRVLQYVFENTSDIRDMLTTS